MRESTALLIGLLVVMFALICFSHHTNKRLTELEKKLQHLTRYVADLKP